MQTNSTKIKLNYLTRLIVYALLSPFTMAAQQADSTKLIVADIITIHSLILNEDRKIYIYIPHSAFVNSFLPQAFPVLYLLDGDKHTAMVASQVNYLSELFDLPPMIVIGISNADNRVRDLIPTHSIINYLGDTDPASLSASGGGETFLQFIKKEVMPYVDLHYKTTPYKILSGHSFGGLLCIYTLITYPDMFNAYIAISPSLWWDYGYEIKRAEKILTGSRLNNRMLFLSDAGEGGRGHRNILLFDTLLAGKKIPGLTYKYVPYPGESHGSEPVKAEYDALKFIFARWKPGPGDTTLAMVKDFYKEQSIQYGYPVVPPEPVINDLGYQFLFTPGRTNEAIGLFEMNVENYPSSINAYDGLGDAYTQTGDKVRAIENYKKAIELNPTAAETIKKLKAVE